MSKRICLLIDSLSSGGAEKVVANLSISLENKGYEVTIVIMTDSIIYNYSGKLYNFGKVKTKQNNLKAFLSFKSFFKKQNFDVILDHRIRNKWVKEFLFSKLIFKQCHVVYCVHHYNLAMYFPKHNVPFLAKMTLVKNRKIITVSQMALAEIKVALNLQSQVIYNYPNVEISQDIQNIDFEYIIAVGRLEKIKQFNVLIESYKASKLSDNKTKLLIFGEGNEHENLRQLINKYQLNDDVYLKGFQKNIEGFIANSKALVMSSHSEGFPMVLIEALALKTPVISFDCKSGPSEIIENNRNGILVKNQDKEALTDALNQLLDETYYQQLKTNLANYNSPFTEEKIMAQWINVIEND